MCHKTWNILLNFWALGVFVVSLLDHFWTFFPFHANIFSVRAPTLNWPAWMRCTKARPHQFRACISAWCWWCISSESHRDLTFDARLLWKCRPACCGLDEKEKAGVSKVTEVSSQHSQRVPDSFVSLFTEISFTSFMDGRLIRCRLIDSQPFSEMRTGYLSVKIIIIISEPWWLFSSTINVYFNLQCII